ncbi:MAG: VanZ family protein [Kofleriaceae bacterium]|nr:VanZ family protein [Kofleriaceae bacterium]
MTIPRPTLAAPRLRPGARPWLFWAGAAALAATIFVLSSMSAPDLRPPELWRYDKLVHASVWTALAALLAAGGAARGWRRAVAVAVAVALAVAWGALDELHQSTVPHRDASWGDLLADTIGACLGATIATSRPLAWLVYGRGHGDRP